MQEAGGEIRGEIIFKLLKLYNLTKCNFTSLSIKRGNNASFIALL